MMRGACPRVSFPIAHFPSLAAAWTRKQAPDNLPGAQLHNLLYLRIGQRVPILTFRQATLSPFDTLYVSFQIGLLAVQRLVASENLYFMQLKVLPPWPLQHPC
jgi:hypothetical protein